ncbi:MAG TPA: DUF4375 domain-containing protein [Gemmataceae bacterium]|nr:DUF4375 domain-containing protein [Gemmataceae bacterium]
MIPDDRLTEVFDRGLREGLEHLTPAEQQLYLIQYFILDQEMNGLSGYFFNQLPDLAQIQATIDAMRRYGLINLATLLDEALQLFRDYADPNPSSTWEAELRRYDPSNRLNAIWKSIGELDNYGLAESSIA